MRSRQVALISIVFGLSLGASGCAKKEAAQQATAPDEEPVPVELAATAQATIPAANEGTKEAKDKLAANRAAPPPAQLAAAPGASPGTAMGGGGGALEAKPTGGMAKGKSGNPHPPAIGAPEFATRGGNGPAPLAIVPTKPAPTPRPGDQGFARTVAAPEAEDTPAAKPVAKLDPNARYATTYRPGGAALAAFDAAVQKGDIPGEYKDLVGDFGSRYAPSMDAPKEAALAFKVETERGKLPPSGGLINFRVAIRSSATETKRAPLSVHLVLDVSGSMSGAAIDNARKAAASLVERLDPNDDFSMVTFSSSAEVRVPDGLVGARRKQILATIADVQANGGTNISSGLDLGYAEAHSTRISPEAVKIVMLLSDGHANGGDTNPRTLAERSARAFQDGIQTSSFGLGADFDAPLMSSIADRGAGGYYYLADSTQIASALAKEMDSRLVPAALGVEVRVRLRPDVSPIRVYGSRALEQAEAAQVRAQEVAMDKNASKKGIAQDRQDDTVGGMRFFMPAFARDDRHALLMQLQVPAGVGERSLVSVEVKYKDRIRKKNVTEEYPVKIEYAKDDAESASTANASVVATVQAFLAGDSIVAAEHMVDAQNRLAAMRLLQERAELLKRAAVTLNEGRLGEDAIRLARLSRAVGGQDQVKDALPLAVLLRGSSYGYLK